MIPKVMIMAGGTGGHVFPALAVAEDLISRGCEVQWLGTDKGIEARVVPENGLVLNRLNISGVRGKGRFALLAAPWKIVKAIAEARSIFKVFKPDVVLGMGGYVSGPGGVAAWLMGIPLVVHEQNARPGTTNKLLAKIAKKILSAFPDVLPKAVCIGNPIRKEIVDLPTPSDRMALNEGPFKLLILGGSLGAKAINELLPKAIKDLPKDSLIDIQHQTGPAHFEVTSALYKDLGVKADIKPFIDDMANALSWADLVVCRSGALTVSELSAVGVASILVPFPFAIDDHQTANADWLVSQGAAYLQPQNLLTAEKLRAMIIEFMTSKDLVLNMAMAARSAAKPNATKECADICLELAHV